MDQYQELFCYKSDQELMKLQQLITNNSPGFDYMTINKQSNNSSSVIWTQEEENFVKYLRQQKTVNRWDEISAQLTHRFGKTCHTGKQCRQRYINSIKFTNSTKLLEWEFKEQDLLFQLYTKHGSKWGYIADHFQNKSENNLKNKFYGSIRKLTRKLNTIGRQIKRLKKPMKYEALLKILQIDHLSYYDQKKLTDLKTMIISFAKSNTNEIDNNAGLQLINSINKFSLETRSIKAKKHNIKIAGCSRMISKSQKAQLYQLSDCNKQEQLPYMSALVLMSPSQQFASASLDKQHGSKQTMQSQGGSQLMEFSSFNEQANIEQDNVDLLCCGDQYQNDLDALLFH